MKKKAILGLLLLTFCFVSGGLYISSSINHVIVGLEDVISLHQVEFLRENLLNQIKIAQTDLLLKDSPHSANVNTIIRHGEKLEGAVNACFGCHHSEKMIQRLTEVKDDIKAYQKQLSRVYTIRANSARVENEKHLAFALGEQIREKIEALVPPSVQKVSQRISVARNEIFQTKQILIALISLGPLLILLATSVFVRRFANSVSSLMYATRKIKEGELTYRIPEKLHDEFQELAVAFNEMGAALKDQCQKVESAQKRYRLLFESAGDAIFILEAEGGDGGQIVSANPAAAEMHGYTLEELQEMKIQDLAPESAEQVPAHIRSILAGEWIQLQATHRRKDGSHFPVEVSAGLFEVDGHRFILAFNKDISERIKTEKALRRSKQMAMVGQMAAGLAHEIKNPLAGIKVSMEVLVNELELEQEEKEIFLRIVGEINRIEKLLKNLLNYARPPKPQLETLDLNQVLDSSLKNFELSLKNPAWLARAAKEIRIDKPGEKSLPPVLADSAQLQQVFLNLLLNAAEALGDQGSIAVEIGLTPGGEVQVSIADTGKGIDAQSLKEIFNPFFTTKNTGTGLGLAISKRLIEQHHGTIAAANNPDRGATFTVTLPAAPVKGIDRL